MKKRVPLDPDVYKGAIAAATRAGERALYMIWHPDFGTTGFTRAVRDWNEQIPIEDVYFAAGKALPVTVDGLKKPKAP